MMTVAAFVLWNSLSEGVQLPAHMRAFRLKLKIRL
jgi:hypothetical protein